MNAYKKYKNRFEQFLQTERGKRFINFAYSFGAAIVILGAMFKLLHFPWGNEMLFIGMVTECIVFILSAFDTPLRDYRWEQVFPVFSSGNPGDAPVFNAGSGMPQQTAASQPFAPQAAAPQGFAPQTSTPQTSAPYASTPTPSGEAEHAMPLNLSAHSEEYGRQMENLNRTLSGLNSIYEIQLKSVSGQIGSIEQINQGLARLKTIYGDTLPDGSVIKAETEKMAEQLRELNEVYARMLHAMTVNRDDNPNA